MVNPLARRRRGSFIGFARRSAALLALCAHGASISAQESDPTFNADIRPIFVANCFSCHGPDRAPRQAGLRLDDDSTIFAPLPSGATPIVPEGRAQSALFQRISTTDINTVMPPSDSGKSLSPSEIETIGQWIDEGAVWEQHWAFQPLHAAQVPDPIDPTWSRNDIDRFIAATRDRHGLTSSPEADRRTLIRRLTFDLHGLPPTPEEVDAFVNDAAPDAYERLVDRLLASPRYGERWARHWLDVVHYGDTHGYDKDKRRPNAWPYRDYVIEALSADLPYGQFVREQLAADVLAPEKPSAIAALGFIAAGPWDFVGHAELREGTMDKKITRLLDRDDMVMNTMNTFVSMTVQCARCHDHKFDPIAQAEYYGLQAVFAGVDRADRPMDTDVETANMRAQLTDERDELSKELEEKEKAYAAITSTEIELLDSRISDLRTQFDALKQSPTNGYHSAIEPMQDVTKWVQVDLGASLPIESIHLLPARPTDFADTPGFGFPVRFTVAVSDDSAFGTSHIVADQSASDFPNAADMPYRVDNPRVSARYVRVSATRLWERTNDFAFALAEIRVLSGGMNVALNAGVTALDSIESGRWSKAALVDGYSSRNAISADGATAPQSATVEAEIQKVEKERDEFRESQADPALVSKRKELHGRLSAIDNELKLLPEPTMVYAASSAFKSEGSFSPAGTPRPVHVLRRGDVNQEAEPAVPGALSLVVGLDARFAVDGHSEADRRAALAEWIADPRNPLTWRSIVNRVWHYHFGQGIVETPSDFGHMGAMPTHPELHDWLATEFLEHGQSLKWLHKTMVTSATYRQSSTTTEEGARIDAGNRYLWRMNRRQLDAESLRDATLAVSGKLDLTMGGPGYDLFVFKDDHSPGYYYDQFDAADPSSFRRSIYRFIVRSVPDPFMTCLDSADPSQNVPVRNSTITALQALAVMNNPFMLQQSEYTAQRIADTTDNVSDRIAQAYRLVLSRDPSAEELSAMSNYTNKHGLPNAIRVILNTNEFMFID